MKDYYEILQVSPNAEPEVIASAYRRLARKYHPDAYAGPDATERMRELNEAYEVLSDLARRAEYDRARRYEKQEARRAERETPPRPPPREQQPTPAQTAKPPAAKPARRRRILVVAGLAGLVALGVWIAGWIVVDIVGEDEDSSSRESVGQFEVMGSAMEPSFPDGALVDVVQYGAGDPERGDVVVFESPKYADTYFMKRIIGLPGDKAEIRDGVVYVNDDPLDEPYTTGPAPCPCGPWYIEEGQYFVLGDNRSNSADSRAFGLVPEANILGRVKGDAHRPIILRPMASPAPATATAPPFLHPNPQSLEQATVEEVIDGDTIDVLIDGQLQRVRYYGIDAPEEGEKCYEEATKRNRELVGTSVRLEADARNEDNDGRLLRYVFNNDGISVDAALVNEGLAKAWREDGRYLARLTTLEIYAHEHGIGCLWR